MRLAAEAEEPILIGKKPGGCRWLEGAYCHVAGHLR